MPSIGDTSGSLVPGEINPWDLKTLGWEALPIWLYFLGRGEKSLTTGQWLHRDELEVQHALQPPVSCGPGPDIPNARISWQGAFSK